MSLLDALCEESSWLLYAAEKEQQIGKHRSAKALEKYITNKEYLTAAANLTGREAFPLPEKKRIRKPHSEKKRVVYTYPDPENRMLKMLTYMLLRKYDSLFASNLYSFRPEHGAKEAIRKLAGTKNIRRMYVYKADISDYFNSINVSLLLPILQDALADDRPLFNALKSLLCEPMVLEGDRRIIEQKGIMAGTPQACFYANLYLYELDDYFENLGITYARYSDDIIVFAETGEMLAKYVDDIRRFLAEKQLTMNPEKEEYYFPGEKWSFLGFSYQEGILDIAPASVDKLKGKMRRKREALHRWQQRKGLPGEKAAKAFIRVYNRKLFEADKENDLTWTRWYFPVINTTESLKAIDLYAQDCIRYLISGTHTKARFNVRYEDMKTLGYRSLVHSYYQSGKESSNTENENSHSQRQSEGAEQHHPSDGTVSGTAVSGTQL